MQHGDGGLFLRLVLLQSQQRKPARNLLKENIPNIRRLTRDACRLSGRTANFGANTRFGLYRWHIMDPVRFEKDLKVTVQALGWRNGMKKYLPLQDDISSVAYWYQTEPHAAFPKLPEKDYLEIR